MDSRTEAEFGEFMRGRWSALVRLGYGLTGDERLAERSRACGAGESVRILAPGTPSGRPGRLPKTDHSQREPWQGPQAPGARAQAG